VIHVVSDASHVSYDVHESRKYEINLQELLALGASSHGTISYIIEIQYNNHPCTYRMIKSTGDLVPSTWVGSHYIYLSSTAQYSASRANTRQSDCRPKKPNINLASIVSRKNLQYAGCKAPIVDIAATYPSTKLAQVITIQNIQSGWFSLERQA
jgi:hypothetical protein